MKFKWWSTGLFILMSGISLLLFWIGSSINAGFISPISLWVILLALLLPSVAVYYYSKKYSQRMEELIRSIGQIAQGNFRRFSNSDAIDELGRIFTGLNDLSWQMETVQKKELEESNKMETLLTSMHEGVIVLDQVGRIVIFTAAENFFNRSKVRS